MKDEAKPQQTADFWNALAVAAANPEELLLAGADAMVEAVKKTAKKTMPDRKGYAIGAPRPTVALARPRN